MYFLKPFNSGVALFFNRNLFSMRSIKFLALVSMLIISCKKTTVNTQNFYVAFKATLNGASETPANSSAATGTASATYNLNTRVLLVNVTYTGLTATMAHIHKGAVGVGGGIIFTITNLASPINTSFTLDAAQEADLLANLYYVNIHSAAYINGEIRGQLVKQ